MFCCDKHTFVVTKDLFCRDKHMFVATKVSLSRQNFGLDKIMFVMTSICHHKIMFVATKVLSRQAYFCRDKRRALSWQQTQVCRDKKDTYGGSRQLYLCFAILWELDDYITIRLIVHGSQNSINNDTWKEEPEFEITCCGMYVKEKAFLSQQT